jgi:hypothetical protein
MKAGKWVVKMDDLMADWRAGMMAGRRVERLVGL